MTVTEERENVSFYIFFNVWKVIDGIYVEIITFIIVVLNGNVEASFS